MKLCRKCGNLFPNDLERCLIDGSHLEESGDPAIGKLVGGCYRIDSKTASGGTGDVYLARHEYTDLEVAIKILKPILSGTEEFRQRTMREARICATIDHPNIMKAYDLVSSDNMVCLVMERLHGETLRSRLQREGVFDIPRSMRILSQTAEALSAAHSLNVVHRDIKPSNIFLSIEHGLDDFVKLLDFGIAYVMGEGRLTLDGQVLGTPTYMPPELLRGGEPSKASDIYSLACVAYKVITGKTPFSSRDISEVIAGHLDKLPIPISQMRPGVPAEVEVILLRMLEKDPAARYQDAFELLHELRSSGLYSYGIEERPSEIDVDGAAPALPAGKPGWGEYFEAVAEEATDRSESYRQGQQAAIDLERIEEQKREILGRMDAIETMRRSTQRNIARAIKTLHEDLSRMRDGRERGQMEYLAARTEKDFLESEIKRIASDLEPVGEMDDHALFSLISAGDAARRLLEVRRTADDLSQSRSGYRESVEDVKFQIARLTDRLREVEQEHVREYEDLRKVLDEVSAQGEELRRQAALAALKLQSGKGS